MHITLHQLIQLLPPLLRSQNTKLKQLPIQERIHFDTTIRGTNADPVTQLFGRVDITKEEWREYAFFDEKKNYTRNLICYGWEDVYVAFVVGDSLCCDVNLLTCSLRLVAHVSHVIIRETSYECNDETDTMEVTSDVILKLTRCYECTLLALAYLLQLLFDRMLTNTCSCSWPSITFSPTLTILHVSKRGNTGGLNEVVTHPNLNRLIYVSIRSITMHVVFLLTLFCDKG